MHLGVFILVSEARTKRKLYVGETTDNTVSYELKSLCTSVKITGVCGGKPKPTYIMSGVFPPLM